MSAASAPESSTVTSRLGLPTPKNALQTLRPPTATDPRAIHSYVYIKKIFFIPLDRRDVIYVNLVTDRSMNLTLLRR